MSKFYDYVPHELRVLACNNTIVRNALHDGFQCGLPLSDALVIAVHGLAIANADLSKRHLALLQEQPRLVTVDDGTVTSEKSKGKSIEDKGKRGKAYRSGRGFVGVSFMSPAHARKLCVERRQAWLRTPEFAPK